MRACRSCQAQVRFVRSAATERWMIIDAEPSQNGNVVLMGPDDRPTAAAVLGPDGVQDARRRGTPLFTDHHVTCPKADEWRKGRAR